MNLINKKKNILLVEASDKINLLFIHLLENKGYHLVCAAQGADAILKANALEPDLIICNSSLAGNDGFQFYDLFNKLILNNETPFIVLFEHFGFKEAQIGLEIGVDNFIAAPLDRKVILEKIKNKIQKAEKYKNLDLERFETLFNVSPISAFVTRFNKVERANSAFYNFFNLAENSILPTIEDLFDFEKMNGSACKFNKCLKGQLRDCYLMDIPLLGKSNVMVDLQVSHFNVVFPNSTLVQMVVKNWLPHRRGGDTVTNSFLHHPGNEEEFNITRREIEILKYSAKGVSIKGIALKLGISDRTVEKHRSNILRKTNTANIIEALSHIYGVGAEIE